MTFLMNYPLKDMVTIHFCHIGNSSLDIVLRVSSCGLPKKESHTGFETHEDA